MSEFTISTEFTRFTEFTIFTEFTNMRHGGSIMPARPLCGKENPPLPPFLPVKSFSNSSLLQLLQLLPPPATLPIDILRNTDYITFNCQ